MQWAGHWAISLCRAGSDRANLASSRLSVYFIKLNWEVNAICHAVSASLGPIPSTHVLMFALVESPLVITIIIIAEYLVPHLHRVGPTYH